MGGSFRIEVSQKLKNARVGSHFAMILDGILDVIWSHKSNMLRFFEHRFLKSFWAEGV